MKRNDLLFSLTLVILLLVVSCSENPKQNSYPENRDTSCIETLKVVNLYVKVTDKNGQFIPGFYASFTIHGQDLQPNPMPPKWWPVEDNGKPFSLGTTVISSYIHIKGTYKGIDFYSNYHIRPVKDNIHMHYIIDK